jgi:chemotaxis signal transduction protein
MNGVLRFRMGEGDWAIDVRNVRRIVAAGPLQPLPAPLPGIIGLLAGAIDGPPIPVLAPERPDEGRHVIVLEAGTRRFGLRVSEVTGVLRGEQVRMGPAPAGQDERLVTGTVETPTGSALLLDAYALSDRLEGEA